MLKDITIGQHFPGKSPVHMLDPRLKIGITVAYVAFLFMSTNAVGLILCGAMVLLFYKISNIPLKMLAKSLKPIIPLVFFTVILNLVFSALAAYPLARMDFKGKNATFYLILATIMVPFQAIMLPIYLIVIKLNMVDTVNDFMGYLGLILPFAVNAFGIFLMRQAFLAIPKELEESAF
ncbi:MAG: hypothetical protein RRX95_05080, partial [Oscillospiraceae bacterium]